MRVMFAGILVAGVGLAGFAVYMAQDRFSQYQSVVERQREALAKNVKLVPVYIAKERLEYGTRVTPENVELVRFPEDALPEGVFSEEQALFGPDEDEVRTVVRTMEPREVLMAVKVTEPGEEAGFSSRLTPGMRAFAIRVDVASGVSGFVNPGDRVDVYWTGQSNEREVTKLILDGVKVIAIDQNANSERMRATVARTVTVETNPRSVAALAQAQSIGRLSLSLRGTEDSAATGQVEVDMNTLLGIQEEQEVAEVKEEVCTIKNRRGNEVVEIEIPCAN